MSEQIRSIRKLALSNHASRKESQILTELTKKKLTSIIEQNIYTTPWEIAFAYIAHTLTTYTHQEK